MALSYAREAGRLLAAGRYASLEVAYKSRGMRSPVTDLDREVESYLRSAIARDFPGHAILGEEGTGIEAGRSEYCWVLDPLDGTTNFVNGLPFFAVSIGVLFRLAPVAGAIFAHQSHLGTAGVYHAARGMGARLDEASLKIADSGAPSPGRLASVPGSYRRFEVDRELRKRHGEPRVLGSVALEMALTGAGVFQFAVFGSPKIWDVAAGALIVSESGGVVLASGRNSANWERLENFSTAEPAGEEKADLRGWSRPLIAGSTGVATFVASHLKLRAKPVARERSDSSRAGGKPGSR